MKHYLLQINLIALVIGLGTAQIVVGDTGTVVIAQAIRYLESQQGSEGSIGGLGVSAWAAVAFDAAGVKNQQLIDYLRSQSSNIDVTIPTEVERHILAIVAQGEDPTSFGGINFVEALKKHIHDGQIGDTELLNDDFFGILAFVAAGEQENEIILQSINYIIQHQRLDGSWGFDLTNTGDVDMTAAGLLAIQAGKVDDSQSIAKAKQYINSAKNRDGGYGYQPQQPSNTGTTSWVLWALHALSDRDEAAFQYLRSQQNQDGSMNWQNSQDPSALLTAYAIIALSGKTIPNRINQTQLPLQPPPSPTLPQSPPKNPLPLNPEPNPNHVQGSSPTITITPISHFQSESSSIQVKTINDRSTATVSQVSTIDGKTTTNQKTYTTVGPFSMSETGGNSSTPVSISASHQSTSQPLIKIPQEQSQTQSTPVMSQNQASPTQPLPSSATATQLAASQSPSASQPPSAVSSSSPQPNTSIATTPSQPSTDKPTAQRTRNSSPIVAQAPSNNPPAKKPAEQGEQKENTQPATKTQTQPTQATQTIETLTLDNRLRKMLVIAIVLVAINVILGLTIIILHLITLRQKWDILS